MAKLSDHFKVYPGLWEHPYNSDELLDNISFVFTMNGHNGLFLKLKQPLKDDYGIGMDMFEFAFDRDNGIYIQDGDMRFNEFVGGRIRDSGVDVVPFIKTYLKNSGISDLIKESYPRAEYV